MYAANVEQPPATAPAAARPRLVCGRPIRRVMFFGKNMSRTRCTGALVDGLAGHGLDIRWINYATVRRWLRPGLAHAWVRRRFQRFRPDMVMVFCRDLPLPLLQEFGRTTPVVLWMEEALHDLCPEHVEYMRHASLVCVSNPTRMPMLKEQGIERVEFLMSGFSPRFHHPERATPRRDVVFIGGPGQRGQRVELLARVSRHFDTEIYGVGWEEWAARYPELRVRPPVKARGFRHLCASSRIVLGLNQFNDDALYFSNRTWLSLACRGFHLTHYVPGLETVLRDGVHLAWYHDADECLEKIDHYLKDATARERIAAAGCELAHAKHQYYHRVGRVLELVEGRTTSASLSLSERLASRAPLNGHADGHLNGHANGHLNGHGSVQATRSTP